MKAFPFQKSRRLTLKKEIEVLFRQGRSIHSGYLRLIYHIEKENPKEGIKVLITVPSKKFRNATDRNRIRRLIREAYRLNYARYLSENTETALHVSLGFIYTGTSALVSYKEIEEALSSCLKKLVVELQNS